MSVESVTVSSKGGIVIPAKYRRKYDLQPGRKVNVVDNGGVLSVVPASKDPVKDAYGLLAGGPSLVKALLRERARELRRENDR
jgi:AbrB family looped-hinge helix DNA binding protein